MVTAPEPEELFGFGPSPDGRPLELHVACPPERGGRGGRHAITIHPDWTVDTPHDLEAERVAVAFGGYCACLELVERSIPAVRAALPMLTRHVLAPIRQLGPRAWVVQAADAQGHCCRLEFRSAHQVATHLRSAGHQAIRYDAPLSQVRSLLRKLEAVWIDWEGDPPPWPGAHRLVREDHGLEQLWLSGIHPRTLAKLAAYATGVDEALPLQYYLGLAYGDVDPAWLSAVVARRPDADTAAWLATLRSPEASGSADEWGAWLGFGIARHEAQVAVGSQIPSSDVADVLAVTRWSRQSAARNVIAWALVGCRPSLEHYRLLDARGVDHARPSIGTIQAAVLDVTDAIGLDIPDRTEIAVMLELLGSRPALLSAVRRGLRSAAAVDAADDLLPYSRPRRTP